MATRQFMDVNFTILKRKVELYAAVSVGAAGAVTLQRFNYPSLGGGPNAYAYSTAAGGTVATSWPNVYAAGAEGTKIVTRTGTGAWTITLQDNYVRLLGVEYVIQNATGVPVVGDMGINSTLVNMTAAGGSVFGVQFADFAGLAVDPASGDLVLLTFTLQDATEP